MHNIVLTMEAIYDITELSEYIEINFNRERADKFQKELQKELSLIETFPEAFEKTQISCRGYLIHKKPFILLLFSILSLKMIYIF